MSYLKTVTVSPKGDPEVEDQAWGEIGNFCTNTTELRWEQDTERLQDKNGNFKWKILFRIEWGEKEGSQIVLTKDKG